MRLHYYLNLKQMFHRRNITINLIDLIFLNKHYDKFNLFNISKTLATTTTTLTRETTRVYFFSKVVPTSIWLKLYERIIATYNMLLFMLFEIMCSWESSAILTQVSISINMINIFAATHEDNLWKDTNENGRRKRSWFSRFGRKISDFISGRYYLSVYILKITWKPVWYRDGMFKIYSVQLANLVYTSDIYNSAAFYRSDMPYRKFLSSTIVQKDCVSMCA